MFDFRRFIFLVLLLTCKNRNYAFDVSPLSPKASSKTTLTRGTVNDIVSRNITMVLDNLLMNYENNQLPTHGKGKETICMFIYKLTSDEYSSLENFLYHYTKHYVWYFCSSIFYCM